MSAATKRADAPQTSNQRDEKQALFFKQPYPLTHERHANAGLREKLDYSFAKDTNSVAISVVEFIEAARSYPIVFSIEDSPKPIAVLGLNEENQFVDKKGYWDVLHYVPAQIRKYPFGLSPLQNEEKFALCVDEGSDMFMAKKAKRPFFVGEEISEMVQKAFEICKHLQTNAANTERFCRALKDADLLAEKRVHVTLENGDNRYIAGFLILDEDKWNRHAQTHLAQWHQNGLLPYIYLVLISQMNWKYLALR